MTTFLLLYFMCCFADLFQGVWGTYNFFSLSKSYCVILLGLKTLLTFFVCRALSSHVIVTHVIVTHAMHAHKEQG